jgi:hypothetical protein
MNWPGSPTAVIDRLPPGSLAAAVGLHQAARHDHTWLTFTPHRWVEVRLSDGSWAWFETDVAGATALTGGDER